MRQRDHLALIWLRLGIFHLIQYKLIYCQSHVRLYSFPQDVQLPEASMESRIIILEKSSFPVLEESLLALQFNFLSKVAKSVPVTTSWLPSMLVCAQLCRELWVVNQGNQWWFSFTLDLLFKASPILIIWQLRSWTAVSLWSPHFQNFWNGLKPSFPQLFQ